MRPSGCKVITVQPCFDIDTADRRIKEYNISTDYRHFSEKVNYEGDPTGQKYFSYHHGKECQAKSTINTCGPRNHFVRAIRIAYEINLQRTSCLALQVLPETFTRKIVSKDLLKTRIKRRIQTVCHHYFIITGSRNVNFNGYYMKNFTPKDKSRTDILSNDEESSKYNTDSGMAVSFDLTGKLAMINFVMDLRYFVSPSALVAQNTEKVSSESFKFQMARIKENPYEIMVLFWSVLKIDILKNTNVINQCKKIDIKVIPNSQISNNTTTCTDAFVRLKFYRGYHEKHLQK